MGNGKILRKLESLASKLDDLKAQVEDTISLVEESSEAGEESRAGKTHAYFDKKEDGFIPLVGSSKEKGLVYDEVEIVEFLEDKGVDADVQVIEGWTDKHQRTFERASKRRPKGRAGEAEEEEAEEPERPRHRKEHEEPEEEPEESERSGPRRRREEPEEEEPEEEEERPRRKHEEEEERPRRRREAEEEPEEMRGNALQWAKIVSVTLMIERSDGRILPYVIDAKKISKSLLALPSSLQGSA